MVSQFSVRKFAEVYHHVGNGEVFPFLHRISVECVPVADALLNEWPKMLCPLPNFLWVGDAHETEVDTVLMGLDDSSMTWRELGFLRRQSISPHVSPVDCAYPKRRNWRSEEHTSELQSRLHLVCRLLLE